MRATVDAERLEAFMRELGRRARGPGRVYLTGGATAVLLGWRPSTVDVDIKMDPEPPGAFEAIAKLENEIDERLIRYPGLDADAFRQRARAFLEADGG